ncbi:flagellar hook protein FlgE [Pullulanibacillus pueri]|uniref:Flagellar hook protein FlgE n=1 Tax=Pullulanibacillus pueri TaxID=1437324 RepID=A0A8J2ZVT9_9BACL|nr:flagellar hook protein FlgE [Pullulanibacillus pueri]MBM7682483.1 flagellar hook protein FlgE [Pullulanibacillus pueri]GGH82218.1 flagellar hook protein FlgE [Pullulanibacillus pueri]
MLRSMYSAISGLKNFQTKLDVIGNNIANVNTTGFKKGRITFSDLVSQQISGASAPTYQRGGTNPIAVGLGSQTASVDSIDTQGSTQTTGRALDLAISGDGYFVVKDGANSYYTRAGNFYLDTNGNLVNSAGLKLMGYGVDEKTGGIDKSKLTNLGISDDRVVQPQTSWLNLVGNLNYDDLKPNAGGTFPTSDPISFEVFDSNGNEHTASITLQGTDTAEDKDGNPYISNFTFTIDAPGSTPASQTGTITMDTDGSFKSLSIDGGNSINFDYGNGSVATINQGDIDFSALTAFQSPPTAEVVGDVTTLDSYSIGSSGEIYGVLSNGDIQLLGQVVLSQFNNPGGLESAGGLLYKNTSNSGDAVIVAPGENGGTLQAGALEMSNVDLSEEFTDMIEAQRGFQANARVITTADSILEELVNLKR